MLSLLYLFGEFGSDVTSGYARHLCRNETKLKRAHNTGEETLRQILWWFFNRDEATLKAALIEVDKHILS